MNGVRIAANMLGALGVFLSQPRRAREPEHDPDSNARRADVYSSNTLISA